MAKKFKDYYDLECAKLLSDKIQKVDTKFDSSAFISHISKNLDDKPFLERQDVFVDAFEVAWGVSSSTPTQKVYVDCIEIFTQILGPELQTETGMFTHGWWLWPIGRFVQRHAAIDFEKSQTFIYELTKRFTGEFAIRTLLQAFPERTMNVMLTWSTDKNVHVRRLASEGVRPKLPWASRLIAHINDPKLFSIYEQIITNLNQDPTKFVQKSVGNNLNDLMKEDTQKAKSLIAKWRADYGDDVPKATAWIIKHGLRSQK
jgi:3-methyladenine DNA glycosylase AlkC